jgi:hypothetical protein
MSSAVTRPGAMLRASKSAASSLARAVPEAIDHALIERMVGGDEIDLLPDRRRFRPLPCYQHIPEPRRRGAH